jgi:hypothetical protein
VSGCNICGGALVDYIGRPCRRCAPGPTHDIDRADAIARWAAGHGDPDRTVTPDDLRRAAAYLRRLPARGNDEAADLVRLVELFEREGRR